MPRKYSKYRKMSVFGSLELDWLILALIALIVFLLLFHMQIVVYIGVAAFVAETVWFTVRKFQNQPLPKGYMRRSYMNLIYMFVLLAVVWIMGKQSQVIFGILVGIFIVIFVIWQVVKWQRRKVFTSDIDANLLRALRIMDSTAKWYNNEDEANKELVTCLKSLNVDATYGYKLPNGRTADAKVVNVLIEGKLSPDTTEVDRLIGQLTEYTQYSNKVNIVIYGQLDRDARRRIENEIHLRYTGRVFLTCLSNPKRQRAALAI